jgi:hypothetical protein
MEVDPPSCPLLPINNIHPYDHGMFRTRAAFALWRSPCQPNSPQRPTTF